MNDTNIIKAHKMWMSALLIAKSPSECTVPREEPIVRCTDDRSHSLYNNCIQSKLYIAAIFACLLACYCYLFLLAVWFVEGSVRKRAMPYILWIQHFAKVYRYLRISHVRINDLCKGCQVWFWKFALGKLSHLLHSFHEFAIAWQVLLEDFQGFWRDDLPRSRSDTVSSLHQGICKLLLVVIHQCRVADHDNWPLLCLW